MSKSQEEPSTDYFTDELQHLVQSFPDELRALVLADSCDSSLPSSSAMDIAAVSERQEEPNINDSTSTEEFPYLVRDSSLDIAAVSDQCQEEPSRDVDDSTSTEEPQYLVQFLPEELQTALLADSCDSSAMNIAAVSDQRQRQEEPSRDDSTSTKELQCLAQDSSLSSVTDIAAVSECHEEPSRDSTSTEELRYLAQASSLSSVMDIATVSECQEPSKDDSTSTKEPQSLTQDSSLPSIATVSECQEEPSRDDSASTNSTSTEEPQYSDQFFPEESQTTPLADPYDIGWSAKEPVSSEDPAADSPSDSAAASGSNIDAVDPYGPQNHANVDTSEGGKAALEEEKSHRVRRKPGLGSGRYRRKFLKMLEFIKGHRTKMQIKSGSVNGL
ncbi:hypothetical protein V8E54_013423 [Elaphomyces granulatus]|jgi:hypothetical protein